jgi:ribosomal protein S18 acetylase RimI-like enzyme
VSAAFRIEALAKHDRNNFDCGNLSLNDYFQHRVSQDQRRRFTACFVAVEHSTDRVAGYYTLAAGGVACTDLREELSRKLPRYPSVPVVRLGRLAIDRNHQGQRLGGALLIDALKRAAGSEIAAYAMVVDAIDEQAVAFYEHYGFQRFESSQMMLFMPFSDALKHVLRTE